MNADTLTRALAAIDAATGRADAVPPGPWESLRWRARADGWFVPALVPDGCPVNDEWTAATAAFVAHARTDVPLLSAAARALAGVAAWWRDIEFDDYCAVCGGDVVDGAVVPHKAGCPRPAADAALAALAPAAGDGRGSQQ